MKILATIRVIPIGTSSTSLSNYVAEVVKILEKKGIRYVITPFNTAVELENLKLLNDLIEEISSRLRSIGVMRIAIDIQLDLRFDKEISLEYKVESVKKKLDEV
ncbi:MAG: MTH1187 family thiamine-binding protein [Sulfolobales archaeon]